MALICCPECGTNISEFAKKCSNCGLDMTLIGYMVGIKNRWLSETNNARETATFSIAYDSNSITRYALIGSFQVDEILFDDFDILRNNSENSSLREFLFGDEEDDIDIYSELINFNVKVFPVSINYIQNEKSNTTEGMLEYGKINRKLTSINKKVVNVLQSHTYKSVLRIEESVCVYMDELGILYLDSIIDEGIDYAQYDIKIVKKIEKEFLTSVNVYYEVEITEISYALLNNDLENAFKERLSNPLNTILSILHNQIYWVTSENDLF